MRIGIMCHASFGGSARVATELAVGLASRNQQVHLFTRTLPFGRWDPGNGVCVHTAVPEWANGEHPANLVTRWSEAELNTFITHVARVIVQERLDVLHFHYAVPFAEAALKVRRYLEPHGSVLVGTLHGTDVSIHGRSTGEGPRLSRLLPKVETLTTVSNAYAQLASSVFQLAEAPRVIPNFVDLTRFQPQLPGEGDKRTRPRLIHISNFRPVKDAKSMARIFVDLRKRIDVELWLVGDGPEMPAVQEILQRHGVENDVRYWGLQRDVSRILAQADLLLLTSLNESFSLVALEAMACGVPVVTSDVGGIPEVVVHGETGMLFSQGDREDAVRLAFEILSDPGRHQLMRWAAIEHAQQFDRERIIPLYEALYRELLYRHPAQTLRLQQATNGFPLDVIYPQGG